MARRSAGRILEGMSSIYPPKSIDPDPAVGEGGLMFSRHIMPMSTRPLQRWSRGEEKLEAPYKETDEIMAEMLKAGDGLGAAQDWAGMFL